MINVEAKHNLAVGLKVGLGRVALGKRVECAVFIVVAVVTTATATGVELCARLRTKFACKLTARVLRDAIK